MKYEPEFNILITGSNGFVAKNFANFISGKKEHSLTLWSKEQGDLDLRKKIHMSDIVVHLASSIKNKKLGKIFEENIHLATIICEELKKKKAATRLLFASTIKLDGTEYSKSKIFCENMFYEVSNNHPVELLNIRLPALFGKWSKPNHASVVATFCHNAARGLPLILNKRNKPLQLAYIDHVVEVLYNLISSDIPENKLVEIRHQYEISIEELHDLILEYASISPLTVNLHFKNSFTSEVYSTYKWFECNI